MEKCKNAKMTKMENEKSEKVKMEMDNEKVKK